MAMARLAPMDGYTRRYFVTVHVIERFRERLQAGNELIHRDDQDLGNVIDVAVVEAVRAGKAETVIDDKEDEARLVDLRQQLDDDLYALLKGNYRGHPPEAVVTLLTGHMVERDRRNQRMRPVIGSLGAKLLAIAPEVTPPKEPAPVVAEETLLLTYLENGQNRSEQVNGKAAAAKRLEELIEGGRTGVRLWREIRTRTRVVVEVE
jgi:hypothetical protein